MATRTAKFIANTTWQQIVAGAKNVTLNPVSGYCDLYIGTSLPSGGEANTFLLKPVAGENYLDLTLGSGDNLYVKSRATNGGTISWIET